MGHGFNAKTGEYGDLIKAGVIDPVKVTRSAPAEHLLHRGSGADHRDPGGWPEETEEVRSVCARYCP